jgi:KTSC domain
MPSTVIRKFKYEADSQRLVIQFQSGRRYAYFDVPPEIYSEMRRASSRGAYFNTQIRDRYSYSLLDEEDDPGAPGCSGNTH